MNNLSVILLFISTLNVVLSAYLLKYRKHKVIFYTSGFLLAAALHSFGYSFELSSVNLADILFWMRFKYIGISFVSVFALFLVIIFAGKENKYIIVFRLACFAFSVFMVLIIYSCNFQGDFYQSVHVSYTQGMPNVNFVPGLWYWVLHGYVLSLLVTSFIFLFMVLRSDKLDKLQAFTLILGTLTPIASYIVYFVWKAHYGINLATFSYVVIDVFFALGIIKHRLFDFIPTHLQQSFDDFKTGILVIDHKMRIIYINKSVSNLFPDIKGFIVGNDVLHLLAKYPLISSLISAKRDSSIDTDFRVDGDLYYFRVTSSKYYVGYGKQLGKIISFYNITDLKEEEITLQESNKSKDKFLSIISHELKNAFNILINFSEQLEGTDGKEQEDKKGYNIAEIINRTAHNTYRLFVDLLTWTKLQWEQAGFNPHRIELKDIIKSEMNYFKTIIIHKDINLISLLDMPIELYADPFMVQTILRNLISNAVKCSKQGGNIILNATRNQEDNLISVTDQGTGLAEKDIKNLFRIDVRRSEIGTNNQNGTGLGLILCKDFVEKHKGRIWVESIQGKGSTFYFSIPHKVSKKLSDDV